MKSPAIAFSSPPSLNLLGQERGALVASLERELQRLRRDVDRRRNARWPAPPRLRAWQRTAAVELKTLLGCSLFAAHPRQKTPRWQALGRDDLGTSHLVRFGVTGSYASFAVLFLPAHARSTPLVIAQHGGLGLVETIAGLGCSSTNYNDLVGRLRRRGCAVLVPQLPMWRDRAKPPFDQEQCEPRLRLLGTSFPALNVLTLRRALDAALARPELRDAPVGFVGLSYGGCLGMYATALDPRIRALLTSCYFNDRHAYPLPPSVPAGAARALLDAELGALVCPRHLWIEVATRDELFTTPGARGEAAKLRRLYRDLGHATRFRYVEFDGTHEFNRSDAGLEFLLQALAGEAKLSSQSVARPYIKSLRGSSCF